MRTTGALMAAALLLTSLALSQQQPPAAPARPPAKPMVTSSAPPELKSLLEGKVKSEWEAFKKKDKPAYAGLLADNYVGVEEDGQGMRNRFSAAHEIDVSNIYDYTLIPIAVDQFGPDTAFVTYEVTMQFPPKSTVRLRRVYVSEIWIKEHGDWKLKHYQETRVA
jgi:hypothetical protein